MLILSAYMKLRKFETPKYMLVCLLLGSVSFYFLSLLLVAVGLSWVGLLLLKCISRIHTSLRQQHLF